MSQPRISDQELLAYLEEGLPVERMAEVERMLRQSQTLRDQVAQLAHRRDEGLHSIGEIWRRRRLSCPSRSELGSYVLGTLESQLADFIEFHLQTVGCRYCAANLKDLRQAAQAGAEIQQRRRKFFETSAGYLKPGSSRQLRE